LLVGLLGIEEEAVVYLQQCWNVLPDPEYVPLYPQDISTTHDDNFQSE
jgi:hypothetical protein